MCSAEGEVKGVEQCEEHEASSATVSSRAQWACNEGTLWGLQEPVLPQDRPRKQAGRKQLYRLMDVVRAAREKPESTARMHATLPSSAATKHTAETRPAAGSRAALQKVHSHCLGHVVWPVLCVPHKHKHRQIAGGHKCKLSMYSYAGGCKDISDIGLDCRKLRNAWRPA